MARIGITASDAYALDGSVHRDLVPYVRAIERAGGEPVLLANDVATIDDVLPTLAGVLATGGVDVDPARYGGRADHSRAATGEYRADRDAFEVALLRATRERKVPTLLICRGMQIANVAFAGTLIEDVKDALGAAYAINHRQTYENGQDRSDYAPGHTVALEPESKFAHVVRVTSCETNSMHHQALRELGEGLVVVGRTPDGVIEAVEGTFAHPFFFGVQWHPEELAEDPVSDALFAGLVRAADALVADRTAAAIAQGDVSNSHA